jgi:hypothetical protein
MTSIYGLIERGFEKLVTVAIAILDNSITFIITLCTVIFWFSNRQFYTQYEVIFNPINNNKNK